MKIVLVALLAPLALPATTQDAPTAPEPAPWAPAGDGLLSRFAADVDPAAPHPEYPRPQLVRERWANLNGLWDYAIVDGDPGVQSGAVEARDIVPPETWDGRILVPFPVESALSGVGRRLGADQCLVYRRDFEVPDDWDGDRVLLHFGAVDWQAVVTVDGTAVGMHRGGYDPFHFDITDALAGDGPHELVVEVHDPTDAGPQPRGKQVSEPRGIWYTPVSGIWQTVWMEPVPEVRIEDVATEALWSLGLAAPPNEGKDSEHEPVAAFRTTVEVHGLPSEPLGEETCRVEITYDPPGEVVSGRRVPWDSWHKVQDGRAEVGIQYVRSTTAEPWEPEWDRFWSPDDPKLHDVTVTLKRGDRVLDRVTSYAAMRIVEVRSDASGHRRLFLNGEPLFQLGLLDQGYWPDGLYTAPTDDALRYDLEVTKDLGFNMVRKHVKVEPDRWYHHCDRLGLLVWQDIPSGGPYIGPSDLDPSPEQGREGALDFHREASAIVRTKSWSPSIVSWVIFNEGWGQYDTAAWAEAFGSLDPTRIINSASGWTDRGVGDVLDLHAYPGPASGDPGPDRAVVLGEFGGLGLPVAGHTWQDEANWGYRSYETAEELTDAYVQLMKRLSPLVTTGLAAAVYTQTTDVEIEVNGLLTYDRALVKLDEECVRAANAAVFEAPTQLEHLVGSAGLDYRWWPGKSAIPGDDRGEPGRWRFTGEAPPEAWILPGFNDSSWDSTFGGIGSDFTPGGIATSDWPGDAIWARRSFELFDDPGSSVQLPYTSITDLPADARLALWIHHDEDAQVWLNGRLVAEPTGYTVDYVPVPIELEGGNPRKLLVDGLNHLAVTCTNTYGARYIDCGLVLLLD